MEWHIPCLQPKIYYQIIVNITDSGCTPLSLKDLDGDVAPTWIIDSTFYMDFLYTVLPFEEEILEAMMSIERPRDDLHHWSYFFLDWHEVESILSSPSPTGGVHIILNPLDPAKISTEGNMSIISETISVNISRNPNIIEKVFIGAKCSPEEIKSYTDIFK